MTGADADAIETLQQDALALSLTEAASGRIVCVQALLDRAAAILSTNSLTQAACYRSAVAVRALAGRLLAALDALPSEPEFDRRLRRSRTG